MGLLLTLLVYNEMVFRWQQCCFLVIACWVGFWFSPTLFEAWWVVCLWVGDSQLVAALRWWRRCCCHLPPPPSNPATSSPARRLNASTWGPWNFTERSLEIQTPEMRNSCEFLEKLSKLPAWCQLSGAELIFMLSWADGSEKYQKIGTSEFYLSYWKMVAAFNANSDIG